MSSTEYEDPFVAQSLDEGGERRAGVGEALRHIGQRGGTDLARGLGSGQTAEPVVDMGGGFQVDVPVERTAADAVVDAAQNTPGETGPLTERHGSRGVGTQIPLRRPGLLRAVRDLCARRLVRLSDGSGVRGPVLFLRLSCLVLAAHLRSPWSPPKRTSP